MKAILAVALLTLTVVAVAQELSPLNARVDHWRQRLAQELPVGSARDVIIKWASKNSLEVSEKLQANELAIRLESSGAHPPGMTMPVPANTTVCTHYEIRVTLKLDIKSALASADVVMAQNCFTGT